MCNRWNDTKLTRSVKPQRSFHSFAEACAYAIEMAKQHSRGDYAVFECIGRYVSDCKNPPGKIGYSKPVAVVPVA